MSKHTVLACNLRTFMFYLWIFVLSQLKAIPGHVHNVTDESLGQLCWNSTEEFICDPIGKLRPSSRQILGTFLKTVPRDTPCLCRPPCSDNEHKVFPTKHLAIGVVLPVTQFSDRAAAQNFASRLRSKWSPGACPGNDVLFLVLDSKVYIDYGNLSIKLLARNCLASLPNDYKRSDISLRDLAAIVKDHLLNPCPPTSIPGANAVQSWLKIPTMLLACFCLLLWLVFIGRRAHLRRLSASASAQLASRYQRSLYDLPSSHLFDRHPFGGTQVLAFRPSDRAFQTAVRSLNSRRLSRSAADGDDDGCNSDSDGEQAGYRLVSGARLSSGAERGVGEPLSRRHVMSQRGRTPSPPPAYCSLEKTSPAEVDPDKPLEEGEQASGSAGRATPLGEPDLAEAPPAYADLVQSTALLRRLDEEQQRD